MTDPREYAPPAVRNQAQTDQPSGAEYIRQATAYVERSLAKIDEQRAHIDAVCETLANGAALVASQAPIDPVIDGLLEHLPKPGSVWPEADREVWLSLVKGSFKLIYRETAAPATSPPASA